MFINHEDNRDILKDKGFTPAEIERLSRLRRDLWEKQTRQMTLIQRHLEFMRWLIKTGQVAE